MKLVIDIRLVHNSGIGTYIKNIVPIVVDYFDEVYVMGNPAVIREFEWSQKVKIIPLRAKVYSIAEQVIYPFRIPNCDIFWTPHFNVPLAPIRASKRMVTIHDVNHLSNPEYFSFPKRLWAKILYKNAIKRSNIIYTVSEFSKSEILRFFRTDSKKIKVVYGGVDPNFGNETPEDNNLELPQNYFLFVGNVKPHKNLITLLKAYNHLDAEIKEKYKLVILGRKEGFITQDTDVFDYIKNCNLREYIHFTGYVQDDKVPEVYKNTALFIFPSLYEGFGLPILEAIACKVPVLSSNKASLPEVGGDAVMYFDPNDEVDLAKKIMVLINDQILQAELREKGLEQIKKFDWKKSAANHIKVFDELQ